MMKRILAVILVVLLLLCGTASAKTDLGTLLAHDSVNLVLTNAPFSVTLSENPSTGYSWSLSIKGDGIKQTGEFTDEPKQSDVVGAPVNKTWIFSATKQVDATLTFTYARSWETGVAPAQTVVYRVKAVDATAVNTIKKNRTFTIALTENPSTGYSWSFEKNPAFKLISTKSIEPKATATTDNVAVPGVVGAPVQKVWTFKALKKGIYTLKFSYARSWETGVKPEDVKEYVFNVK